MVKLSEQIAQTCCGVLADKQDMIDRAVEMEEQIKLLEGMGACTPFYDAYLEKYYERNTN